MTIDDVLDWIAGKNAEIAMELKDNLAPAACTLRNIDVYSQKFDLLEELRHLILMRTNPYNREDIKRANAKIDNEIRLNMQFEIIQFLANNYYHLCVDDNDINDMARSDSYKIMEIMHKYVPIKSMEG